MLIDSYYQRHSAAPRSLAGVYGDRPLTYEELLKRSADAQKYWWGEVCKEPAVAAYLADCAALGKLNIQITDIEASIKIKQFEIDGITEYFKLAKQNKHAELTAFAKSKVINGAKGLSKKIDEVWNAKEMWKQGFGAASKYGWQAARYKWTRTGGAESVTEQQRIPGNDAFFADLPTSVFQTTGAGGAGILYFAEWFGDPVVKDVILALYSENGALAVGTGKTRSLWPDVAEYVRQNIRDPAIELANVWKYTSTQLAKDLTAQRKVAEGLKKIFEENLTPLKSEMSQLKQLAENKLNAITDPLSYAIAKKQGDLILAEADLQMTTENAEKFASYAAAQAAGAASVANDASRSGGLIKTSGRGTEGEMANRVGTLGASAFAAAKRGTANKRNSEADVERNKGRDALKIIEDAKKANPGIQIKIDLWKYGNKLSDVSKLIEGTAGSVIDSGKKIEDALKNITDSQIDKKDVEATVEKNNEDAAKLAPKKGGGGLWLLLLLGAAAAARS